MLLFISKVKYDKGKRKTISFYFYLWVFLNEKWDTTSAVEPWYNGHFGEKGKAHTAHTTNKY